MISIVTPAPNPIRARGLLLLLIALGFLTLCAVLKHQPKKPQCGAFTIGVSAIGSCDGIGASPTE
jgi:hypothetical protein